MNQCQYEYEVTIGDTYQRGQQERTIVGFSDSVIYYQNKTDKKLGLRHGCSAKDFFLWVSKATKKSYDEEIVVTPTKLTVAQKRVKYLAPSRLYFTRCFEKLQKEFSFESWAYQGLHWADWGYIVRLVCHSFGVSTVDQLEESQLEEANELATNIIAFIFKANVDMLKRQEVPHD